MANKQLIKLLLKSPIAYHKCFTDIMRSVSGGVFLSQVYYWWQTKSGEWNYKFNEEFINEIGLSEWELRKAKEHAIKIGIIECKMGKLGKLANVPFYKINEDILFNYLNELAQQISIVDSSRGIVDSSRGIVDSSRGIVDSSQPLYTENTTKTTTYTKEKEKESAAVASSGFNYEGFNDREVESINSWLQYRKEIKKPYKASSSFELLRNKLLRFKSNGSLIETIEHSIAMQFIGLFCSNKGYINNKDKKPFNYVSDFSDIPYEDVVMSIADAFKKYGDK